MLAAATAALIVATSAGAPLQSVHAANARAPNVHDEVRGDVRASVHQSLDEPNAPLAVQLAPQAATVDANGTQHFTATVTTGSGIPISDASVTWNENPAAGTIASRGDLTAALRVTTMAGSYPNAITAVHASGSASANVVVRPATLASITITPSPVDMVVDTTQMFTAVGRDEFNNVITDLSVTWSVAPAAGVIVSSGPTTMTFRAGLTPGVYVGAVQAISGAISGAANVSLRPGPPASVVISPSVVTLDISATQTFTASVFDKFGNPRPELGVTWLTPAPQAGVIESSTPNSAVFRAGTVAGTFASGLQASNPPALASATVVIRPGAPAKVQASANPATIKTDGVSSSTVAALVTDQYGNFVGAGIPVAFTVDACDGACTLQPTFSATNSQSRATTLLRSTYTSATATLSSNIRVVATINGGAASGSVDVIGTFTPYRNMLPATINVWLPSNHTACTAFVVSPPATLSQPADNTFNIYRFTAMTSSYTVLLNSYATTGQLLLYRITSDTCATSGTMSLSFIAAAPITGSSFQTTFANVFIPSQPYLLAINTSVPTNQPYTITIQP